MNRQNLLLLTDVEDLGKSGDVVSVRPGFSRNFLLPKKKAVVATKHTLQMQEKLREERSKLALVDRQASEELAKKIEPMTLAIDVKVDPEGKMYGSVSVMDIVHLLEKEKIFLEKKNILLKHPIKEAGVVKISLKLKEDVLTFFHLKICPETTGLLSSEILAKAIPEEISSETKTETTTE